MSKINIRGVICPSVYDQDVFYTYIQRGIITPESYLRKQIEQAKKDEDLTCYINSPGGSVFAGGEMINALVSWKAATGKKVKCEVGSMAASMAAVMIIQAADSVAVHKNTKIMFHGASTETAGGEQAHKDTMDLLNKINAECKITLTGKYNLDPAKVDEWFAEGRAGWLTAEDAMKCGIAQEVINNDGERIKATDSQMSFLMEKGLQIAAIAENFEITNEENPMIEKIMAWLKGKGLPEQADEKTVEEFTGKLKTVEDCNASYQEGFDAGKLEGAKNCELQKQHDEIIVKLAAVEADKVSLEAEKVSLASEVATLKAKNEKLAGGLNAPSDEIPLTGISGYEKMITDLTASGLTLEAAQIQIQRQNPILFKSFLTEVNKNRKK